jgi:hypothetical protein
MQRRLLAALAWSVIAALLAAACGGKSPTTPTPSGGSNAGGQQPPSNNLPVIDSISVQGSRPKQPANFADIGETIAVSAKVHDDETAVEQLQYQWSAPEGSFAGTGASVTWAAPADIQAAHDITITLKVVEKYGANLAFEHSVTSTATLSLHNSIKEVGDMSRQFLIDFSDTNLTDADYVIRNFSRARCPQPAEVDSERADVVKNYTDFIMQTFKIGPASVTVNFGGTCPVIPGHGPKRGDACAIVPSFWDSIKRSDNQRRAVDGDDIIAAAYSGEDKRWWLCASDYRGTQVSGPPFPLSAWSYLKK